MSETSATTEPSTKHAKLVSWVNEIAELTQPDAIHWCDGSAEEYDSPRPAAGRRRDLREALRRQAAEQLPGALGPRATSRASRTAPSSAPSARRTPARPTTGASPSEMRGDRCSELFNGCMRGRTMYVVPFSMGPLGSPISQIGVQLTDSPYVVVNMRIMTRMGAGALEVLGEDGEFVPCVHSVGMPLEDGQEDVPGPATPTTSTSSTSPRRARSGRSAPATAATRCSARSASPCASPRSWRATRAGWPSTC